MDPNPRFLLLILFALLASAAAVADAAYNESAESGISLGRHAGLATHKNAIGVAVGASLGHTVCTSLAVVGGSMLASMISQRTVATIGGVLFLGFSLSSYFYPPLR